eukprot:3302-Heterococcus_DN1.PRE.1
MAKLELLCRAHLCGVIVGACACDLERASRLLICKAAHHHHFNQTSLNQRIDAIYEVHERLISDGGS